MRDFNIYEKSAVILIAQADHLDGEVIGTVIDDFYSAGAYNVQVIPSITKKNRPGYLFFIDCGENNYQEVEKVFISELGITGWHKLSSGHRHVGTEIQTHTVTFNTPEGDIKIDVKVKAIKRQTHGLRPERDSCLDVRTKLRAKGLCLSLSEIRTEILKQIEIEKE